MPTIEINGKKLDAEPGSMIIEVADNFNIQIPRFCYHKKLSIAANCRMCLVDVERAPKPLPACATPVTEGMKVWTHSPKALLAQKSVMEFLLINHPLDCPICDQGGECELQDLSMGYGQDGSRYNEGKRVVKDKNIGPLISTDITRCIQCTRCVRFGTEVAGLRELGATGRGECMEIGTFIERNVTSEVSGNVIDLCPVGALTSKPFRFAARGWELQQTPSISVHDCVGSNLLVHSRRDQVMRVVPKENELINEIWLSDRDRFSYEGISSPDRLLQPKIKEYGEWQTVSWQDALEYIAIALDNLIKTNGSESLGGLISPNATVEEGYLFQKWLRALGTTHIDHRCRQQDFRHQKNAPSFPSLGIPISAIEQQSVILLVGSHLHKEQPILGLKLRKMTLAGGKALVINPIDFTFNFEITHKSIVRQGDLVFGLARLAKAVLAKAKGIASREIEKWLAEVTPTEVEEKMAKLLCLGEKKLILLGALAINHPAYSQLTLLAQFIKELTGAQVGVLTEGASQAGAWLTGCVPHRLPGGKPIALEGYHARDMIEKNLKGYVLFNLEPDKDFLNGAKALKALQAAELVIAISPFTSDALLEVADVLLPLATFAETSGTLINVEGQWQSFKGIVSPPGESRPGWKILRVLGNISDIAEFDYENSEEILRDVKALQQPAVQSASDGWVPPHLELLSKKHELICLALVPLYATDNLVRRAKSLQATADAGDSTVRFNQELAIQLKLKADQLVQITGTHSVRMLPFVIDERVPNHTILISDGDIESYSTVEIKGV